MIANKQLISTIVIFILLQVFATDSAAQNFFEKDSTYNKWHFRTGPYVWLLGFQGTIIRPPEPPGNPPVEGPPEIGTLPEAAPRYDIDLSFRDIRHSIKFALMFTGQYRNDFMVAQFNVSSLVLRSGFKTPFDFFLQNSFTDLTYVGGDFGLGYRLIKKKQFDIDVLLGAKFAYFKVGITSEIFGRKPVSISRDNLWVDPLFATNIKYRFNSKVEIVSYGDLGPGFFARDDFSYQYIIGINYLFTKSFLTTLGYRHIYYETPNKDALYQGSIKGPLLRLCFQF
ncbi:DUF481 domain-containing protein [Carboxylicivirga sp. N1Y90]|uniref:DUF481 domain-containing protein n=1 Tax=Carboxylicivirga fragile TaxID=3417571 RepID=UPI003D341D97|nr:DUF481 domain-containing protein [Marinilabiliaceae bacterium N1Y90]